MRWLLWCFCLLAESYETINHYHYYRPVTSLGHQGDEKFFESDPNFLNYVQYSQTVSNIFFQGGIFLGGLRLPAPPLLRACINILLLLLLYTLHYISLLGCSRKGSILINSLCENTLHFGCKIAIISRTVIQPYFLTNLQNGHLILVIPATSRLLTM